MVEVPLYLHVTMVSEDVICNLDPTPSQSSFLYRYIATSAYHTDVDAVNRTLVEAWRPG